MFFAYEYIFDARGEKPAEAIYFHGMPWVGAASFGGAIPLGYRENLPFDETSLTTAPYGVGIGMWPRGYFDTVNDIMTGTPTALDPARAGTPNLDRNAPLLRFDE